MLYGMLVALHLMVSIILILVVLLQTGKGADLAGAFGGGGSQTAFGSRGAATVLSKLTTGAAILFMVTSFSLAVLSARGTSSVLDETAIPTPAASPLALPEAAPAEDAGGITDGAEGDVSAQPAEAPAESPAEAAGTDTKPADEAPPQQ